MLAPLAPLLATFAQDAAPSDVLDRLIERSRAIESFSAVYVLTKSSDQKTIRFEMDFQAPDAVHVRISSPEDPVASTSMWQNGSEMVMSSRMPKPWFARIDLEEVLSKSRSIGRRLNEAFPAAAPPKNCCSSGISQTWRYDASTDMIDFDVATTIASDVETPFGWLATLHKKGAQGSEAGDQVSFQTDDGHVDVVVAKDTGLLLAMTARKAASKAFEWKLESVRLGETIDAERFRLPSKASDDEDHSAEVSERATAGVCDMLRSRIYRTFAHAREEGVELAEVRSKIEPVLEDVQLQIRRAALARWFEQLRAWSEDAADRLDRLRDAGMSDDEIAGRRAETREVLAKTIERCADEHSQKLAIPSSVHESVYGAELLEIERALISKTIRGPLRDEILEDFDTVTGDG